MVEILGTHNEERKFRELNTRSVQFEGKRSREKSKVTFLTCMSKWMAKQGLQRQSGFVKEKKLLREIKDRKVWRTMIT